MSPAAARTAALLLLSALPVLAAAPAGAAEELQVSADGVHWGRTLGQPLFDPAVRWVPGDERTATFSVRNRADDRGHLTIQVHTSDPDGLLADGDVLLAAQVDPGGWQPLTGPGDRVDLAAVPSGRTAEVSVRARLRPGAANLTQGAGVPLRFEVILSEARRNDAPEVDGPNVDGLPDTGAPVLRWWLGLAAVAIGGGLALIRRSRHDDTTDDPAREPARERGGIHV